MNRIEQAAHVLAELHRQYPGADCTLDFGAPYQLIVSAILAAQCTDVRVNQITAVLFAHYPDLQSLADAPLDAIEADIRSCGLFRHKARSIAGTCRMLIDEHGGKVPADRDALMALPGVGRKIANLVLGDCFGIPAVVVDTHCLRISRLIGLTDQTDPLKVERDLVAVLPEPEWIAYGHLVVTHGREICIARRPQCGRCPILPWCRFGSGLNSEALAQTICGKPADPAAAETATEEAAVAETATEEAAVTEPAAKKARGRSSAAPASAAEPAAKKARGRASGKKQAHG